MALVVAESAGALVELDVGDSMQSLARLVDSQRELFHSQIDQLQQLVVAQCKLTGVNPLAQEMAAGALSIRIGKRPRDLLNPKAVKYLQSVFSIKDTIGKKETRELSALCGVTVSQVREFFAGQRSRVRKLVRLSREKATRLEASKISNEEHSSSSDQLKPISKEPSGNAADALVIREIKPFPDNTGTLGTVKIDQQDIPNSTGLVKVEEGCRSLSQEKTVPGVDSDDKEFLDNIFNLMRKEDTFSGQVKLLEWVLCIQNTAVLIWFSNNGGISILATWLSQAATEEQTTMLLVIFKVLYHLPLHKALPVHMSAIVPAVNRLRFYRTSDISNRARILLSRWSKVFKKSQALKRPLVSSSNTAEIEALHKKRMGDFLGDELCQSKVDIPEFILSLTGGTEITRTTEPKQTLKLLPASSDSSKKHDRSVSLTKFKERRKVLLVEQPDHKAGGRSAQVVRMVSSNHSRPMSADDIQKAKLRAMFMQHKYGKADPSSSGSKSQKNEDLKASSASQTNNIMSECKSPQDPPLIKEENSITVSTTDNLLNESETLINSNPDSTPKQVSSGMLNCKLIQWKIPPVMQMNVEWSVGAGENSKEVDAQTQRTRREKETLSSRLQDIPHDPKEPWDLEMDFDDSLTPEIPTEQPPDADVEEGPSSSPVKQVDEAPATVSAPVTTTASVPSTSDGAPEPDLELLAVLLKNPDLVFALTSNQGKNLSSEEMVALLDMLKRNGVALTGMLNEVAQPEGKSHPETTPQVQEPPASLPSPTPPSEAARGRWRSEFPVFSRTPVLQPHLPGNRPAAAPPVAAPGLAPSILSMPQVTAAIDSARQIFPSSSLLPPVSSSAPALPPQTPYAMYPMQQSTVPDFGLPNTAVISSMPRHGSFDHGPSSISGISSLPTLPHTLKASHPPPKFEASRAPAWPPAPGAAAAVVRRDTTPDRCFPIQNSYGSHPSGPAPSSHLLPGRRRGEDRNGIELEARSPTGGPATTFPELQGGWSYNDGSRRDSGWDKRPDWSRQQAPVSRDRHWSGGGDKRWRDHDHGRRR
ncbi:homeobox protein LUMINIDEPENDENS [Musa acuminata AAA Group]|uniref:homeobox protein LUMINIDEPENDENS n=1 Tax=Musa acuminata AAA Group TaxID=214697 RepID=UPI0031DEC33B